MRELVGRTVIGGDCRSEAIVSRRPFNTLASFFPALIGNPDGAFCADRFNEDTFGRLLTGLILCIPTAVGSTSGGAVWEHLARLRLAPAAVLCAGQIDSITAAGLAIAATWTDYPIVAVDELGASLLDTFLTGEIIAVSAGISARVQREDSR